MAPGISDHPEIKEMDLNFKMLIFNIFEMFIWIQHAL